MPVVKLPISKGLVSSVTEEIDWVDRLPINMLAVPKQVLDSAGYMRSWPGLTNSISVNGVSRGVSYNVSFNEIYRVTGTSLIDSGGSILADVQGSANRDTIDYVSMPFSRTTQGVVSGGKLNYWDGSKLTALQKWASTDMNAPSPLPTNVTDEQLTGIFDAARHRGRYVFLPTVTLPTQARVFGVTDIENEQRPDRLSPFISVEANFDIPVAIEDWKEYVVIFTRFSIQYFALTGNPNQVYAPFNSLTVRAGIVGRYCKCKFLDSFAILGGPSLESPSVYIISQGSYQEIATRQIQKRLRAYTDRELSTAYMEPIKFDGHEMLILHLPNEVLVYDHSVQELPFWAVLSSSQVDDKPYRGIHHIYSGTRWECGDKTTDQINYLDFNSTAQLGLPIEHELNTPMVQARNKRIFDFEIDNIPGAGNSQNDNAITRMAISITYDGITYGSEYWITLSKPLDYRQRVLLRNVGYSRNNIGFKIRWFSVSPVSISNFRVRIE